MNSGSNEPCTSRSKYSPNVVALFPSYVKPDMALAIGSRKIVTKRTPGARIHVRFSTTPSLCSMRNDDRRALRGDGSTLSVTPAHHCAANHSVKLVPPLFLAWTKTIREGHSVEWAAAATTHTKSLERMIGPGGTRPDRQRSMTAAMRPGAWGAGFEGMQALQSARSPESGFQSSSIGPFSLAA